MKKYVTLLFLVSVFFITISSHHDDHHPQLISESIQYEQNQFDLEPLDSNWGKDPLVNGTLSTLLASLFIGIAFKNYYSSSYRRLSAFLIPVLYQSNYVVSSPFE
ncbi:hypothetical protein FZW96_08300 [Bacillus sp. BGMRC 2118]|nr:hypothetical protein FZW96_08300 [Bacillus sp. BGMRC 2118]